MSNYTFIIKEILEEQALKNTTCLTQWKKYVNKSNLCFIIYILKTLQKLLDEQSTEKSKFNSYYSALLSINKDFRF